MNTQKNLSENLIALAGLETEFKEKYQDQNLFDQINLYKKSIAFFINTRNFERAFIDTNYLMAFIISYLVD